MKIGEYDAYIDDIGDLVVQDPRYENATYLHTNEGLVRRLYDMYMQEVQDHEACMREVRRLEILFNEVTNELYEYQIGEHESGQSRL